MSLLQRSPILLLVSLNCYSCATIPASGGNSVGLWAVRRTRFCSRLKCRNTLDFRERLNVRGASSRLFESRTLIVRRVLSREPHYGLSHANKREEDNVKIRPYGKLCERAIRWHAGVSCQHWFIGREIPRYYGRLCFELWWSLCFHLRVYVHGNICAFLSGGRVFLVAFAPSSFLVQWKWKVMQSQGIYTAFLWV